MARPTDYTSVLALQICEKIANGQSLRAICADPAMPDKSTVLRWLLRPEHDEFRRQYSAAREAQADVLVDEIIEIADDTHHDLRVDDESNTITVDHEHIQRSRLRVDARKWAAAKLAPKKYGERISHEHGGVDSAAIAVTHTVTATQIHDELRGIFGASLVDSVAAKSDPGDPVVHTTTDDGSESISASCVGSETLVGPT